MLHKAIVESISGNKVKVRIPELHKIKDAVGATPTSEIPLAPICVSPGFTPVLTPGDIVFVSFENDEAGTPVVLGTLYCDKASSNASDLALSSLKIKGNAELPPDTKIGNVSPKNLEHISNLNEDVQNVIDKFYNYCKKTDEEIFVIKKKLRWLFLRLKELKDDYLAYKELSSNQIKDLQNKIIKLENKNIELEDKLNKDEERISKLEEEIKTIINNSNG